MAEKRPKRPRDLNQWAKTMVDIATGEAADDSRGPPESDSPASTFARMGGLKGGRARANSLTPERRSEIALKAAQKRWEK